MKSHSEISTLLTIVAGVGLVYLLSRPENTTQDNNELGYVEGGPRVYFRCVDGRYVRITVWPSGSVTGEDVGSCPVSGNTA